MVLPHMLNRNLYLIPSMSWALNFFIAFTISPQGIPLTVAEASTKLESMPSLTFTVIDTSQNASLASTMLIMSAIEYLH